MILYIAKRGPHNIGAQTHLQALKDIFGEDNIFVIDLFKFTDEIKNNYVSFARTNNPIKRLKRVSEGNVAFISNSIIQSICNIIAEKNVDMVFMDESDLGNLVKRIKYEFPEIYIISFYHDIAADLMSQWRNNDPNMKLLYKYVESKIVEKQEKISTELVDERWVFLEEDAKKMYDYYNIRPNAIIPLSSFVPSIYQQEITDEKKHVLFVCSKYFVNIEGFKWFMKEVFPELTGDFVIDVVGDGAELIGKLYTDKRINIVGRVDCLDQYYINSDFVIAPIFVGGGMKVKTLEAFSFGKPIIGTTESLHGFWGKVSSDFKGKYIFKCDKKKEWCDAFDTLLVKDTNHYVEGIRELFLKMYSFDTMKSSFNEALNNYKKVKYESKKL